MPPKKKPLEDARKRLQEKLCNVEEQSEFICQFINDLVDKASTPAKELLVEKDRKKFFQKYSSVSQELEKCLDCLLLISDSVTALGGEDTLGANEDCSSSASESSDYSSHGALSTKPVPQGTIQVPSEEKESKPEKQDTIPVNREEAAPNAATDSVAQQVVKTSYQNVSPSITSDQWNYKQSLPKAEGTVQETQSYVSKSMQEHIQKTVSHSSGQELDSRRSAQGAEHPKPINQQQTEQAALQRVERTVEKKRSPSASSVLSDLIQDMQVSPREDSIVGDSKTLKAVKLKSYPFINGEPIEVVVTEVISPWEFWVQPIGTELDLLMEEMCMHYAKLAAGGYRGGLTTTPSVGEFCCAKFTQDDTWYRAMVTKVEQTHQGPVVELFCVDDGNREYLGLSRLRPLEEKFAKLPCQALCSALSGVRPIPVTPPNKPGSGVVSTLWSQKSVEWLKSKVSGQKLLGFPTRTGTGDLIIIDLYATCLGKTRSRGGPRENSLPRLEFNISEMMLRAGMAQRVGEPAREPSNSSASSLSGGSGESLTRGSSVSIGSSVEDGGVCAPQSRVFVSGHEDSFTDHSSSSRETVLRMFERVPKDANTNAIKRLTSEEKQKHSDSDVNTFKRSTSEEKGSSSDANAKNVDAFKRKRSTAEEKRCSNDDKAKNASALKRSVSEEKRSSSDVSAKNLNAFKRSTSDAYSEGGSKEPTLSGMSELNDERRKGEKTKVQKQDLKPSEPYVKLHQEGHEAADSGATSMTELLPIEGPICLQMIMSSVVSVNEFYVHLVTPEAGLLDSMMEDLNSYYNSDLLLQGNSFQPQIGDHCCVHFKEDGRWYRGLVTSLRCTVDERKGPEYESVEVEVFHIDFGSSEWVPSYDVKPLVHRFMTLPGQVVRCKLANIAPAITEDMITATTESASQSESTKSAAALPEKKSHPEVKQKPEGKVKPGNKSQSEDTSVDSNKPVTNSDISPSGKSRKRGNRKKKKQKPSLNDQRVLVIAAGDESNDSSELSEFEFAKLTPKEDNTSGKQKEGDNVPAKQTVQDSSSADKSAFPEKYLMPSPDKVIPSVNERQSDGGNQEWAQGTKELFEGLTNECRVLVGYMVPWDPWVYQQLFNPAATTGGLKVDVTYKRPILNLNLYDTIGDEDIFINQVLVEVGVADFVENPTADERWLKLSHGDLEVVASSMKQQGESTSPQETHGQRVTSPTSPLGDWNPMKDDFLSTKNTYAVDTDDLDIAIQGYQDLSRRVCHFYSTRSGCWSGDACPNLHVKKGDELRDLVEVFCDNMDSSVTLPDIGTWVAVRVTAVFNPGHFWVQFPYGTEPIENRILAARMGLENDIEEYTDQKDDDLDSLMEKMGKFYSRNLCQDPRRILPAVGELCVAKYSNDNKWYRARITSVDEEELQVFFVDYGNSEWTPENHVKRMLPHFLHLPFQAVECFLGNVVPKKPVEQKGHMQDWSQKALETFHTLTEDKILIAHILSRAWNRTIYVDLFDTDKEEIHINKVLVEKGFASEGDHTVNNPWNIEATVNFNPHKMVGLPG